MRVSLIFLLLACLALTASSADAPPAGRRLGLFGIKKRLRKAEKNTKAAARAFEKNTKAAAEKATKELKRRTDEAIAEAKRGLCSNVRISAVCKAHCAGFYWSSKKSRCKLVPTTTTTTTTTTAAPTLCDEMIPKLPSATDICDASS